MSTDFSIENISFPVGKAPEVEALLEKHDLEYVFELYTGKLTPGASMLSQKDSYMSYSTASCITNDFLPELAKLLVGTADDGQVRKTMGDSEPGTIVLLGGEVKEFDGAHQVIQLKPDVNIEPGQSAIIQISIMALGLGNGKALELRIIQ
jgi:hypothetical protein